MSRASATPSSKDAGGEMYLSVAAGVDHPGATIVVMEKRGDVACVHYTGTHPVGDTIARIPSQSAGAAAKTEQNSALREEVVTMYQLLDDGEWAEHIARTPHGQCLETAITKALSRASAAGAGSEQQGAAQGLLKLCDQLDSMKRTLFLRPGTGQHYSYVVHEDMQAYVEQARAALDGNVSELACLQAKYGMMKTAYETEIANLRAALARAPLPAQDGQAVDDARDAARWREAIKHVGGAQYRDCAMFAFNYLRPAEQANIMRGSVAGHFTQAIDAAMSASRPDDKGEKVK